jgi:excisionase family DNA binding protein
LSNEELFDLAEAAQALGVHPSTLRRWADSGKITHIRTLSGRRRFTQAAIEQAHRNMLQLNEGKDTGQMELKTLAMARQYPHEFSSEHKVWYDKLDDQQRMLFRYSGQRLLGLLIQFISRSDSRELFLEEGKRIAADYGQLCFHTGLSVDETAEAFLSFRRSILESVHATSGMGGAYDPDGHRILLRTTEFFDTLLVATIKSFAAITD